MIRYGESTNLFLAQMWSSKKGPVSDFKKINIRFVVCLILLILQSILSQEILLKKHSAPQAFLESCCEAFPKSFSADPQLLFPLIQIHVPPVHPVFGRKNERVDYSSLEREHETSYSRSQTCCVDQGRSDSVLKSCRKGWRTSIFWWSDPRKQLAAYIRNTSLIMTTLLYSYSSRFFTYFINMIKVRFHTPLLKSEAFKVTQTKIFNPEFPTSASLAFFSSPRRFT